MSAVRLLRHVVPAILALAMGVAAQWANTAGGWSDVPVLALLCGTLVTLFFVQAALSAPSRRRHH